MLSNLGHLKSLLKKTGSTGVRKGFADFSLYFPDRYIDLRWYVKEVVFQLLHSQGGVLQLNSVRMICSVVQIICLFLLILF